MNYERKNIQDCLLRYIENHIDEANLKELAIASVDFKANSFIFSEVTHSHFQIWQKDESDVDVLNILASVELFVLACDILDDLQDADTEKEPWMQIESKYSMNLVFLFLSLTRTLIHDTALSNEHKLWLFNKLATYEVRSLMGQNEDLQQTLKTEKEYMNMIERKSGSFMAFSCMAGSYHAPKEIQEAIEQYAIHIGCSAQIENDLAGISEEQGYKDIIGKELSLPLLYIRLFKNEEFIPITEYYQNKIGKDEVLARIQNHKEAFWKSGAVAYSRTMQMIHFKKGLSLIERVYPDSHERESIQSVFMHQK